MARALAARLPAIIISKDEIRTRLFSQDQIDYSRAQDNVCFQEMLRLTEAILTESPDKWVILDGRTFSRSEDMLQVWNLAQRLRQRLFVIECTCSDEEARRRLEYDQKQGRHPAGNRDYRLYLELKSRREPLPIPALRLDTSSEPAVCLDRCLTYLGL